MSAQNFPLTTKMLNYSNKSVSEQHRKTLKMSDGSGSEGETYEVEKILDKKIVKGKTQYFIKWKGERDFLLSISTHMNSVQQREKTWIDNGLLN